MPTSSDAPRRRGAPLAIMLSAAALVGGGGGAFALAETGALDRTVTRTVVNGTPVSATTTADIPSGELDAKAVYASTSRGVVSISTGSGTGTGFVYDTDGHILTAEHVVDGASSVTVELQDGTKTTAQVLGQDDATDVAVLKIAASDSLQPLTLGSSSGLDIGSEVAAIGDPFGYERSISTGVTSGIDRTIDAPNGFTVAHAIQTDAALNPGNSGGPLVDADGKVVGIVDQIATGSGGADQSSGVGFAVPIDLVAKELPTLEAGGTVSHPYIGVATQTASSAATGALVGTVTSGGPAAEAGLRDGDLITAVDGTKVDGPNALVGAIADHVPGDRVEVTLRRNGETVTESVTLGTQPAQTR